MRPRVIWVVVVVLLALMAIARGGQALVVLAWALAALALIGGPLVGLRGRRQTAVAVGLAVLAVVLTWVPGWRSQWLPLGAGSPSAVQQEVASLSSAPSSGAGAAQDAAALAEIDPSAASLSRAASLAATGSNQAGLLWLAALGEDPSGSRAWLGWAGWNEAAGPSDGFSWLVAKAAAAHAASGLEGGARAQAVAIEREASPQVTQVFRLGTW